MTSKQALKIIKERISGNEDILGDDITDLLDPIENDIKLIEILKEPTKEYYKNEYYLTVHACCYANKIWYNHTMFKNDKQCFHAGKIDHIMKIDELIGIVNQALAERKK